VRAVLSSRGGTGQAAAQTRSFQPNSGSSSIYPLPWDEYGAFWLRTEFLKAKKERKYSVKSKRKLKPRLFHKGAEINIQDRKVSTVGFIFTAQHACKLRGGAWEKRRDPYH